MTFYSGSTNNGNGSSGEESVDKSSGDMDGSDNEDEDDSEGEDDSDDEHILSQSMFFFFRSTVSFREKNSCKIFKEPEISKLLIK